MDNKGIIKAGLIFGGGLLVFLLIKNMGFKKKTKSVDSTPKPLQTTEPTQQDIENAEIAAKAYTDAMINKEPSGRLTELNKELAKEFGMRCYIDKSGNLIVSDVSGKTILKK